MTEPTTTTTVLDGVRSTLLDTLALHDRADSITADTALFGDLPELDSLALVELITALEVRFEFEMDEADITAEVFDNLGSLAAYIATKS